MWEKFARLWSDSPVFPIAAAVVIIGAIKMFT